MAAGVVPDLKLIATRCARARRRSYVRARTRGVRRQRGGIEGLERGDLVAREIQLGLQTSHLRPQHAGPEPAAYAGNQLLGMTWFHEVVVGAGLERLDAALSLVLRGQQDEERRLVAEPRLDRATQLETIDVRHHPVGDHELRLERDDGAHALAAVGRTRDLVAQGGEPALERARERSVVLDEQD